MFRIAIHNASVLIVYERLDNLMKGVKQTEELKDIEAQARFLSAIAKIKSIERDGLAHSTEEANILVPSCMCIISRYPFFHTFSQILQSLYTNSRIFLEHTLEYYVSYLACCLPLPPRGFYNVDLQLGDGFPKIIIEQPPANELPLLDLDFCFLPQHFSIENAIKILNTIMLEHSVLFITSDTTLITPITETVMALMFPFEHQMVYIPVLPDSMLEFLSSPVPFIVGIDVSLCEVAIGNIYPGTCIVNIDENTVKFKTKTAGVYEDTLEDLALLPRHEFDKAIKNLRDNWYIII